jgi:LDH2 family malate/lactate/ureidoglycolate dehydrogenase
MTELLHGRDPAGPDAAGEPVVLSVEAIRTLAASVLERRGFSADHAEAIAEVVVAAERDACPSHGLFRIPGYVASLAAGQCSGTAEPVVSRPAPGVVRVDAGLGFAPLAMRRAEGALVEAARRQGIAALAVRRTLHLGALWPEVERLADHGLVALSCTAALPYVAPHGGRRPLFGTNPIAFGWPRPGGLPPMVFDQASSASARGEIQLRLRDGRTLPEGWAIDADGRPTTDPAAALAGAQLPFGGAKGSALALMVELLAGPLLGECLSSEAADRDRAGGGAPEGGVLVLAIDPARLVPGGDAAAVAAHGERLFAALLADPGTRLPGDRRLAARARAEREGVAVAPSLHRTLLGLHDA